MTGDGKRREAEEAQRKARRLAVRRGPPAEDRRLPRGPDRRAVLDQNRAPPHR